METPLRVLIVEDSIDDTELLLRQLRRAGYDPVAERVQTAEDMKAALEREAWDLVVSDYSMPQFDAPAALNLLNQSGRDIPFLVVSGSIGEDIAVTMMKTGAHDYILKQNLTRFVPAVQRELREAERRRQQRRTEQAKQRLQVERDGFLERLKQENEDLAALTRVTANAISTLDLEELLRVLLERVREVMHADVATILLADGDELRVRASAGAVNLSDSTQVKHVGQGFAGSVASRKKPVYVEDAAADPRVTDPLIRERGIRSMLGVPLKRNGTLIGVLHVDWLTVRPCRDREVHLLEITAERCAAAIQNAQLYQEAIRLAATLATSEAHLRQLSSAIEQTADAVLITDRDGTIQYVNAAFEGMTGYSAAEAVGRKPSLLKSGQHTPAFYEHLWRTITAGAPFRAVLVNRHKSGALLYEEKTITPIKDERGNITHFVSTAKDITDRKRAERQSAGEQRVLELLAHGMALSECLDRLTRECEEVCPSLMCSVLLLDTDGRHLRHGAAPSLPADYIAAIDGIEIGPCVGSCGTAAHTGRTVIVSDIATDPLWADCKELALPHGLRACWSVPILGEADRVLGTLALYSREPRAPQPEELAAHERAAYLASLAILRHRNLEALRQSEARFRGVFQAAPDAILIVNRQRTITLANLAAETLFGYGSGELKGRILEDLVPASARQRHVAHYDGYIQLPKARPMGSGMDLKGFRKDGTEFSVDVILAPLDSSGELFTICIARDITERKRGEDALRESETQFRRLAETSPAGILIHKGGRCCYVNSILQTALGYTRDEMLAMDFWELAHPDSRAQVTERGLARSRGEQPPTEYEFKLVTKSGAARWVELRAAHIDYEGQLAVLATMFDITDRKRAEAEWRESEERFHQLAENINEVFWMTDAAKTQMIYVSPAYETIWGRTCASLYASPRNWLDAIHPEDRERMLQSALTNQPVGAYDEEYRIVQPDGTIRWIHDRAFPVRNQTGEVYRIAGVASDITERQQAQAALQESEQIRRLVLDGVDEIAYMVESGKDMMLSGRVRFVSGRVEQILGYQPEEFIRDPELWHRLIHPDDVPALAERTHAIFASGQPGIREYRIRHQRTGDYRWLEDHVVPQLDAAGRVVSQFGVARDITERKQFEGQMLRTQRLESIGTLAGGVAHDLNNALTPILMSIELLRMEFPDAASHYLEIIEGGAKRGADMVKQLLTFAKGAEGERLLLQPMHLLKEIEKLIKGTFPKNIELRTSYAQALRTILGDATQLHQVLLNLCVNARDAMPHGGTLTLKTENIEVDTVYADAVSEAKPGHYVVWRVTDTGTGIPPKILDRIFEPFFSTKDPEKGTGLGLSTVIGIVKSHGGFVRVYSVPGQGSTFAVYLPASGSDAGDISLLANVGRTFRGNGETILVVDDEATVREIMRNVLTALNFKVITASDGTTALVRLAEKQAELRTVITDLHMPHMDGLSFVRVLRAKLPQAGIIVMSGRVDEREANEFQALGVNVLLDKPFTQEKLVEALKTVFQK